MTGLLAMLLLAPQAPPPEVVQFKAAYAARRGNQAEETPDPAFAKCLNILIERIRAKLRAHPDPSDKEVQSWVDPFLHSVAPREEDFTPIDEYKSVGVRLAGEDGVNFIVGRMGAVTKTVAYDSRWSPMRLPAEFAWNTPWHPYPTRLKGGLWLMDSDEIHAMGMRVGLRLVWLKRAGRAFKKVGEFEGGTTLDYTEANVDGDRVTAHTVDDPKTFWVSASTPVLGRLTTWDCSSGRPRLVGVQLLHQTLRAIDRDALRANRARRPTRLQRRIRKLWPAQGEFRSDLGRWTEKRLPRGMIRVICDGVVAFDLEPSSQGYRVVAVRRVK